MHSCTCRIQREIDIYMATGRGRQFAHTLGFNEIDRTRIEIVILELSRNLLAHAGGGELLLELITTEEREGLAIATRDNGPGIPDIGLALRDGYSTAHTLGSGLPGVQRLMDALTIESEVGVGTHVRAIKWVSRCFGTVRAGGTGR